MPPQPKPRRRLQIPAVAVVVGLFVIGAVASLVVPLYWAQPPAPTPVFSAPTPWTPGDGQLVRGLELVDAPQALGWSPDATELSWSTFDAKRSLPAVSTVAITADGFGAPQPVDEAPPYLTSGAPSVVTARVDEDLVLLALVDGPRAGQTAGVVDMRGLFDVGDVRVPAVVTFGPRTHLAVVARPDKPGSAFKVHVLDVTELIAKASSPAAPAPR